jgi:predicted enzyme related to lactoylglutathione lyase
MAVLRPHLALTVTDVERAIPFYEAVFGTWEVFATHEDTEERGAGCA